MRNGTIAIAALAGFVILLNVIAFILAILFSNWITGTITFTGTIAALTYALYKIVESELKK
jgi:hypothetical protein